MKSKKQKIISYLYYGLLLLMLTAQAILQRNSERFFAMHRVLSVQNGSFAVEVDGGITTSSSQSSKKYTVYMEDHRLVERPACFGGAEAGEDEAYEAAVSDPGEAKNYEIVNAGTTSTLVDTRTGETIYRSRTRDFHRTLSAGLTGAYLCVSLIYVTYVFLQTQKKSPNPQEDSPQ